MKHSKRERTRHLFQVLMWRHSLMGQMLVADGSWSHKTAAEVLADVNCLLSNARSIPSYPHGETLRYLNHLMTQTSPKFFGPFEGA